MNKRIGDYVHLHYSNYQKLGINQGTEKSSVFPDYSELRTKFLSKVPQIEIKDALPQEMFNIIEITRGKSENNSKIKQMNEKIFNTIINNYKINDDTLDKYFRQIFDNAFDSKTYNVILKKKCNKILAIQKTEKSKFVYAKTLASRIKDLNENFKDIINNKVVGIDDTNKGIEEMTGVYKNIYKEFQEFCKALGLRFNDKDNITNLSALTKYQKTFKYKDANNMPKIDTKTKKTKYSLEEVVEIINSYILFNNLNENGLKGGIFEIYLAIVFHSFIETKGKTLTDEALDEAIASFKNNGYSKVVGDTGSKNEILISRFNFSQDIAKKNPDFFKKNFPKMQLILEGADGCPKIQTLLTVQDKIDMQAEFEITMEDKSSKTINANISAKNVNMNNDIHIVTNTSLLIFFNYASQYSDYFTHVMNMFAIQKKDEKNENEVEPQKKEKFQDCLTSLRSFILTQALIGMKENKANIFAVNNNQKGTITFISTYGVLKLLDDNNYNYEQSDIRINGKTALEDYVLANNEIENKDGALSRIDNMLAQLHKDKITASIKPSVINKFSSEKNNSQSKTFSY